MTYAGTANRNTIQKNGSDSITPNVAKDFPNSKSSSLRNAALVLGRNCAITVIIGSALLLQGPDGGIHDFVIDSWGLKAGLMLVLGATLNFRKLSTFVSLLEGTLRARVSNVSSDTGFRPLAA